MVNPRWAAARTVGKPGLALQQFLAKSRAVEMMDGYGKHRSDLMWLFPTT